MEGAEAPRALARRIVSEGLAPLDEVQAVYQEFASRPGSNFPELVRRSGIVTPEVLRRLMEEVAAATIGPPTGRFPPVHHGGQAPTAAGSQALPAGADEPEQEALDVVPDEEEAFFAATPSDTSGGGGGGREPEVGETLGDYELVEVIGRGGMGVVFKARRSKSVHHYAVKVLRSGASAQHEARRKRFQREVEVLRQLDHPNLVRIYGCGRRGEFDWYAMDYVEGTELAQLLKEYRLSPDDKLQVFEAVCRGVAHAHERDVVHRDLKPQNVLVTDELDVIVLDFGLAKQDEETEQGLTREGTSLGTPYYMSPEQVRDPSGVDARTDVWALGVMLYLMSTGKVPFSGSSTGQVYSRIINDDLVPPSEHNAFVPEGVEQICRRALSKAREERYPDAGELLRDVVRHRRGKRVEGQRAGAGLRRAWSRHGEGLKLGLLTGSLVWLVILGVVIGLRWLG